MQTSYMASLALSIKIEIHVHLNLMILPLVFLSRDIGKTTQAQGYSLQQFLIVKG